MNSIVISGSGNYNKNNIYNNNHNTLKAEIASVLTETERKKEKQEEELVDMVSQ